jgi:hypothetical protein
MSFFLILPIPILLLAIPFVFQGVAGRRILLSGKVLRFVAASFFSLVLEVLMTLLGLYISIQGQMMNGLTNLSPGVLGFGFFAMAGLVLFILLQLVRLRKNNR